MRTRTAHPSFKTEPFWKLVDKDTQKALVAEMVNKGTLNANDAILGEMLKKVVHAEGGIDKIMFPGERSDQNVSIVREMIDTSQGQMALLEKVRIDVAFGLADVPLLYGLVYDTIAPAGGFPGGLYQVDEFTLQANVVFLQKFEGGEVEFGTLQKGSPSIGSIQTYAAGFEWTEDMIEFDRTWSIELNNQAFGRSYNALLNHLHLSPIIGYDYAGLAPSNVTNYVTSGSSTAENIHLTLQAAYTATVQAVPRRTGVILLASESNRFALEQAILTPVFDENGNALPNVPIQAIIYYDGDSITRGSDTFVYPGVTTETCFLIFPKRKLKELIHHDLRIDIGPEDISRLVEGQQVGRARRGVFANIAESVQKVNLS